MKTTNFLAAFALAATLSACGREPLFEVEPPVALPLKEQLQGDEDYCFPCRSAPGDFEPDVLGKEQLQDQDEIDWGCANCRPSPPPDGEAPAGRQLKEQLQGDPDRGLCEGCSP